MAIVTSEYYSSTYYGEPVATTEWNRFDARAEQHISQITYGRAAEANFAALPTWQQDAVKTAICAQIEYYVLYGIDLASAGRQSAGFTVGKVRVDGSSSIPVGAHSVTSPAAFFALEQTGLLNPQVATVSEPAVLPCSWGW